MEAGTIWGVLGIAIGLGTAVWQNRKAETARDYAAKLERHLEKGRWLQLRSHGEQIDMLEKDRRHELNADYAAVRASLREQFSGVLSLLAEIPNFTPATVRHWVEVGRLTRPWQVREAMSHLPVAASAADPDTMTWLKGAVGSHVSLSALPQKPELTVRVAAYIILADRHAADIKVAVRSAGVASYAVIIVLGLLAFDEAQTHYTETRAPAWRTVNRGQPFKEILAHYCKQEFYLVCYSKDAVLTELRPYREYFEDGDFTIPTAVALERARAIFTPPVK